MNNQEQRIIAPLIEKPLKRIEIANKLSVTREAMESSLKSLQNKTLIERDKNGYMIPFLKYGRKRNIKKKEITHNKIYRCDING